MLIKELFVELSNSEHSFFLFLSGSLFTLLFLALQSIFDYFCIKINDYFINRHKKGKKENE